MQKHVHVLDANDPLFSFLAHDVYGQVLHVQLDQPVFTVHPADAKGIIFRYVEQSTGIEVACKFYGNRRTSSSGDMNGQAAADLMQREFDNLQRVWNLGLNQPPYRVVRPLAVNPRINYVLVEEFVTGTPLDDYLKAALHDGQETALRQRLAELAGFLSTLHSRSRMNRHADPHAGPVYLTRVLDSLSQHGVIDAAQRMRLEALRDTWAAQGLLGGAPCVLVHGDVTPVNIVYGDSGEVIAIDLERLHEADAARDVGMALAELRHAYLRTTHSSTAADLLAAAFLDTYMRARALNEQAAACFRARCQFYTGAMMLRISRNDWLDMDYRQTLAAEGEQWLAHTSKLSSLICTTR
jgi:aminoglycoside phosphotransferase (APT) family kinase protein